MTNLNKLWDIKIWNKLELDQSMQYYKITEKKLSDMWSTAKKHFDSIINLIIKNNNIRNTITEKLWVFLWMVQQAEWFWCKGFWNG